MSCHVTTQHTIAQACLCLATHIIIANPYPDQQADFLAWPASSLRTSTLGILAWPWLLSPASPASWLRWWNGPRQLGPCPARLHGDPLLLPAPRPQKPPCPTVPWGLVLWTFSEGKGDRFQIVHHTLARRCANNSMYEQSIRLFLAKPVQYQGKKTSQQLCKKYDPNPPSEQYREQKTEAA